jgi:hypothetical protein
LILYIVHVVEYLGMKMVILATTFFPFFFIEFHIII